MFQGASDAFTPVSNEKEERFLFECGANMITKEDGGASTVILLVCDDEGVKKRAREFFQDKVLINECKAVSFWHIERSEEMQCVFLDWFLLGHAHDAVISDNSAFQATAFSRTGRMPMTIGKMEVRLKMCARRYSEIHPLPRFETDA
jgi:hypothetical protein